MIEAKVLAVDQQTVSLEIPGELIFQSEYDLNGRNAPIQPGKVIVFKFLKQDRPLKIQVLQICDPPS